MSPFTFFCKECHRLQREACHGKYFKFSLQVYTVFVKKNSQSEGRKNTAVSYIFTFKIEMSSILLLGVGDDWHQYQRNETGGGGGPIPDASRTFQHIVFSTDFALFDDAPDMGGGGHRPKTQSPILPPSQPPPLRSFPDPVQVIHQLPLRRTCSYKATS